MVITILIKVTMKPSCFIFVLILLQLLKGNKAVHAEERLLRYLLETSRYNQLIRPSLDSDKRVDISFNLIISQLIGVNEREQFMITKVWLPQMWDDSRLSWKPSDYNNITKLQIPSDRIWLPDIVLYNNADGTYEVSLQSNAIVLHNGSVSWMPPAIYKSVCNIKVSLFPFDTQNCSMKFRSWTYDQDDIELNLQHPNATLDDFTPSGEWDILKTPGLKLISTEKNSTHEYLLYSLIIKRKPLFYTVNLIIPCILITSLAILVFYLPSDCGEKMTLCISVLLALTVFLLLISKIVPPTSLDVPLIGKYLMFTMVLVTLSIVASVCVLNIHHRSPSTHIMPHWIKYCFIERLPKILRMERPETEEDSSKYPEVNKKNGYNYGIDVTSLSGSSVLRHKESVDRAETMSPEVTSALSGIETIADHMREEDQQRNIREDWKYVAMVVDRLFLWVFIVACIAGTVGIFVKPFYVQQC